MKRHLDYKPYMKPTYLVARENDIVREQAMEREKEAARMKEVDDALMAMVGGDWNRPWNAKERNHCIYMSLVVVIKTRTRSLVRGESKGNGVVMVRHGKGKTSSWYARYKEMRVPDISRVRTSLICRGGTERIGCWSRNDIIEFTVSDPNLYHFYLTVISHRRCIWRPRAGKPFRAWWWSRCHICKVNHGNNKPTLPKAYMNTEWETHIYL